MPKVKVEVVAADGAVQAAVDAIGRAAKTGEIGDGKVFVYALESAIRIRTGDKGDAAISSKKNLLTFPVETLRFAGGAFNSRRSPNPRFRVEGTER